MDPITQQQALAAAGAGGDPVYVDDVFSVDVYDGSINAQQITNGLDISGEGGLVWIKQRYSNNYQHMLWDTERGREQYLSTDGNHREYTQGQGISSFNSDGYTVGTMAQTNYDNHKYCGWSFRKCPGFFDIQTWTGNGTSGRQIAHDLDAVPKMIWVKCRSDNSTDWQVYHVDNAGTMYMVLNGTNGRASASNRWNNTAPTSTHFTLGNNGAVNGQNRTYVAYLFAADEARFGTGGDEIIAKTGTYGGNGNNDLSGKEVYLGFEPQWVLIKRYDGSGQDWHILDNMRGMGDDWLARLYTNQTGDESVTTAEVVPTADGFQLRQGGTDLNGNNYGYIYFAIRRPNKPIDEPLHPTTNEAQLFDIDQRTGAYGNPRQVVNGFGPLDMVWTKCRNQAQAWNVSTRLTAQGSLSFPSSAIAHQSILGTSSTDNSWDSMTGMGIDSNQYETGTGGGLTYVDFGFKRNPGFFDLTHEKGKAVNAHNLGVVPELMIRKSTIGSALSWTIYHKDLGNEAALYMNDSAKSTGINSWNSTTPTASNFYCGGNNSGSSNAFLTMLFATKPGVSKVGSYTGTGNSGLQVNCGFTNGARFVMIKRANGTGDWFIMDSARGINSGSEPIVYPNQNYTEGTSDYIDPLNSGFSVASTGSFLNTSGGEYIFLAIA